MKYRVHIRYYDIAIRPIECQLSGLHDIAEATRLVHRARLFDAKIGAQGDYWMVPV